MNQDDHIPNGFVLGRTQSLDRECATEIGTRFNYLTETSCIAALLLPNKSNVDRNEMICFLNLRDLSVENLHRNSQ
jgi:hypothetical protein